MFEYLCKVLGGRGQLETWFFSFLGVGLVLALSACNKTGQVVPNGDSANLESAAAALNMSNIDGFMGSLLSVKPTVTGATITSYSLSASLPAGLSFNTNTGEISGMPTAVFAKKTRTLTGNKLRGGALTKTFGLEVNGAPSYDAINVAAGSSLPAIALPKGMPIGKMYSFSLSGAPAGISIDANNGLLKGTVATAGVYNFNVSFKPTTINTVGGTSVPVKLTINSVPVDGTLLWKEQKGSSGDDNIVSTSVDQLGNVMITGYTTGSLFATNVGGRDYFIAKYSSNGTLLWKEQRGSGGDDNIVSTTIDPSGNVVITGYTTGSLFATNAGLVDYFVAKYSSTGTLLWKEQKGSSGDDNIVSTAIDPFGNVIITGYTTGSLFATNAGLADYFIAKYSPTGTLLWKDQRGSDYGDYLGPVMIDTSGNVTVVGGTSDSLFAANVGSWDYFVAKYSSTGTLLWKEQGGSGGDDDITSAAIDASGDVIITGITTGSLFATNAGGWNDYFIAKYSSTGTLLWKEQRGSGGDDNIVSTTIDPSGNVVITGYTTGSLFATNAGLADYFIAKYSPTGTLLWKEQLGSTANDNIISTSVDQLGNVVVFGNTFGSLFVTKAGLTDYFIAKYSPTGTLLWKDQKGTRGSDNMMSTSIDPSGNIVVGGNTTGSLFATNAGSTDYFIAKYTK